MGVRGPASGRGAAVALFGAILLTALIVAFAPAPEAWSGSGGRPRPAPGLDAWLADLADALPIGPRVHRPLVLAQLLSVGLGAAAARFAYQLYRGVGRMAAAVVAGPLAALAGLRWVAASSSGLTAGSLLGDLAFGLLFVLGVGAHLRTLVHAGRTTPVGTSRALAALSMGAVVRPLAGAFALALVFASGLAWREGEPGTGACGSELRPRAGWLIAPLPALALLAAVGPGPWLPPGIDRDALRLSALDPGLALRAHLEALPAVVLFPALALPLVMVAALRWRGGLTIGGLVAVGLLLAPVGRPLLPAPALLAASAICAAGWIWLAGSIAMGGPRVARAMGVLAAAVVTVLAALPGRGEPLRRLAPRRPIDSAATITERGLVIPGDVVVLHDPRVLEPWMRLKAEEGARPDVILVDGRVASRRALQLDTLEWVSHDRRVLSDSFDLGGRWPASWAIEAGPVYWFVFDEVPEARSWFDPRVELDRLSTVDQAWAIDAARERARFRRALGEPLKAASALPLPATERGTVAASVELAELSGVPAMETQLDDSVSGIGGRPDAESAVLSEAADLLFAFGDERRAREFVDMALAHGDDRGLVALARWLARGGREEAIVRLLDETHPSRATLVTLLDWLAARGRHGAALTVRARLDELAPGHAPANEATARLRLLRSLARWQEPSPR